MTDDTEFKNEDTPGTEGPTGDELADLDFGEDGGGRRRGGRRGPGRGRGGHLHVHLHVDGRHMHDEHSHGKGPGRGGSWRGLSDTERIERLEGFQRDLEERAADVATKIARLRARVAEQTASPSDTTPAS
jgi:hypothetical protein